MKDLELKDYISAFRGGKIEKIQQLITKDNINNEISAGYKPILLAAQTGNIDVLEYLISLGADLKALHSNGHGIFYFTAKNKIHNISGYLFSVILVNELLVNKNEKNNYSPEKQLKEISPNLLLYCLSYWVATNDNKIKCMKQVDNFTKKVINETVSKLENIFNELAIPPMTETALVNALDKSGITEFCYIKDFLSLTCFFGNSEILNYIIEDKKKSIKHELSNSNSDEACFSEKSKKILEDYINEKDLSGWTPLHQACELENKHAVKILMKYGAKANILTPQNDDVLFRAVCKENIEILKLLIDNGAVEQFNCDELEILFTNLLTKHFLGSCGNAKKIPKNILNVLINSDLFSKKTDIGENFFHFAVGQPISTKVLNDFIGEHNKKSLEAEDNLNYTPLNIAIITEREDFVDFLLKETNPITSYKNSCNLNIHLRQCKNKNIKNKIIKKIFSEIMSFADERFDNTVKEFIGNIFDIRFFLLINSIFFHYEDFSNKNNSNIKNTHSLPPLLDKEMYEYYNNKFSEKYFDFLALNLLDEIVKNISNKIFGNDSKDIAVILESHLKSLFDNSIKDLFDAIDNDDTAKLKALSKNDKILELHHNDQSILWYATKNQKENVALYLLYNFNIFDVNEKDKHNDGDTLLMLACDNNLDKLSIELINKGANIYLKNNNDVDIFKKVCMTDNLIILKHLRNSLPKVVQNKYGVNEENLLICAASHSSNEAVNFLISNGFSNSESNKRLDEKDKFGKTAIMYAYDVENYSCIDVLLNAGANPQKQYIKNNTKLEKWLKNWEMTRGKSNMKISLLSNEYNEKSINNSKSSLSLT